MPNFEAVDPLRPLTRFSMLLMSLVEGDSDPPEVLVIIIFFGGGGDRDGGEVDCGAGEGDLAFLGRTEWKADPEDGELLAVAAGDEGDAHGDFAAAVGEVDAGGAVGEPAGRG